MNNVKSEQATPTLKLYAASAVMADNPALKQAAMNHSGYLQQHVTHEKGITCQLEADLSALIPKDELVGVNNLYTAANQHIIEHERAIYRRHVRLISLLFDYEDFLASDWEKINPSELWTPDRIMWHKNDLDSVKAYLTEQCREMTECWQSTPTVINHLIAPALLHETFYISSSWAITMYSQLLDDRMLATAKAFITSNTHVIYSSRSTRRCLIGLFSNFADDKAFISSLLPASNYYMFYQLAAAGRCDLMKQCWEAATVDQRNKMVSKIIAKSWGSFVKPPIVYAFEHKDTEMYRWLWQVIKEHSAQCAAIKQLIKGISHDALTSLFCPADNEFHVKTAKSLIKYDASLRDNVELKALLGDKMEKIMSKNELHERVGFGVANELHKQSEEERENVWVPKG